MPREHKPGAGGAKKAPFGGYYNRPLADDDVLLTQVGPDTPGGEYLRCYWHPFMLASELADLPIAVRLLGEDLVVFRDRSGRLGLLHRHCAHRGASLEFGIPAERGIRCCYHGWQYDVDGTILDTPGEPETSRIRTNFCQGAYHVREEHGLLFAYMGPPEAVPGFPVYDVFRDPIVTGTCAPFKLSLPCNWVQIVENAADPIHNAFLHAIVSRTQFSPAFKVLPALDFIETPMGFLSMATRKVGDFVFLRAGELIMPNVAQFPTGSNAVEEESVLAHPGLTRWATPLDDHHSLYIGVAHLNELSMVRSLDPDDYGVDKLAFIGQTNERPHRERQEEPGDYEAMTTPGPIANRKAEHLGTTDRGVVMFRRLLAAGIAAVGEGRTPTLPRLYGAGAAVRTYAHETVLRLPAGALSDRAALAEFGRRAAGVFIAMDDVPLEKRDEVAQGRVRAVLEALCAPVRA